MGLFDAFKKKTEPTAIEPERQGLDRYKLYDLIGFYSGDEYVSEKRIEEVFTVIWNTANSNGKSLVFRFDEVQKYTENFGFDVIKYLRWDIKYIKEAGDLRDKALQKKLTNSESLKVVDKDRELLEYHSFIVNRKAPLPLYLAYGASVKNEEEKKAVFDVSPDIEGKFLTMRDILGFSEAYKFDIWGTFHWYWVGLNQVKEIGYRKISRVVGLKETVGDYSLMEYVEFYDLDIKDIKKVLKQYQNMGYNHEKKVKLSDIYEKYGFYPKTLFEFENENCWSVIYQDTSEILVLEKNMKSYKTFQDGLIVERV